MFGGVSRALHSSLFAWRATHLLITQLCCGFLPPSILETASCPQKDHSQALVLKPHLCGPCPQHLMGSDHCPLFQIIPPLAVMTPSVLVFSVTGPSSKPFQKVPSPYSASKSFYLESLRLSDFFFFFLQGRRGLRVIAVPGWLVQSPDFTLHTTNVLMVPSEISPVSSRLYFPLHPFGNGVNRSLGFPLKPAPSLVNPPWHHHLASCSSSKSNQIDYSFSPQSNPLARHVPKIQLQCILALGI